MMQKCLKQGFCKTNDKGHVIKQVKIAHSFLQSVRSVSHYHVKLAYVIIQMAVKEFLESDF